MKRFNWQQATTWLQRQGTAACLVAALCIVPATSHADVIGVGDVSPEVLIGDPDVEGPLQFGGDVEGAIIVGGTGDPDAETSSGQLTIDIPTETDRLTSDEGIIGGTAQGLGVVRLVELNSQWVINNTLTIGQNGQGIVEVISGARIASNGEANSGAPDLVMGQFVGSQGLAVVDGDSSLMLGLNAVIGVNGLGAVEVIGRGRFVSINSAVVGAGPLGEGSVLLDGRFSTWLVGTTATGGDQTLIVGDQGYATVDVQNQARAQIGASTVIGNQAGSSGEVTVDGRSSALTTNTLAVGNLGLANLNISNTALVQAFTSASVGGSGFVNLANGTLQTPILTNNGVVRGSGTINSAAVTNNGDIRNSASIANLRERLLFTGTVNNEAGAIIESIGGEIEFLEEVTNSGQIFGQNAILRFRGGLTGTGSLDVENTVIQAPLLAPLALGVGESAPSSLTGNFTLSAASMTEMTVGDDDFSQFLVNGNAALGGTLNLVLDSGYVPQLGDSFELFKANSLSGTFSSIISPGSSWTQSSVANSLFVTYAGAALPGVGADFNGDGIVNGDDLAVWKANFGKGSVAPPALQSEGDANGDGVVDGNDYMILQRKFGGPPAVAAGEGALAAVPEPSSVVLAMAALALPVACRRRRSR